MPSCYRSQGTEPPRCDTVAVVIDQRKTNIDFHLTPGAAATGRVVDQDGRPIAGATVRLGLPRFDARFASSKPAQTSRDGTFSMTNLPVGGYWWKSTFRRRPGALRPPIVYFPGVLMFGDASFVELVAGETTNGLTIVAPRLADNVLSVRVVTIEQALAGLEVSFVRRQPLVTRPVPIDANGLGSIKGLAPGRIS